MASREEMIAAIQAHQESQNIANGPSREEMIQAITDHHETAPEQGFLDQALGAVKYGADKFSSWTAAPTRAAVSAGLDGKNPVTAFANQFNEDPATAPSGAHIAEQLGVPTTATPPMQFNWKTGEIIPDAPGVTRPNMRERVGTGVDLAADWTNAIPGALALKESAAGVKAGEAIAQGATKAVGATAQAAKAIPGVEATVNGAKTVANTAGKVGEVAVDSVKNTAAAIKKMFAPHVSEDFEGLKEIAAKNNIDPSTLPESIEFGDGSFISRAARHRAEGVTGEKHLAKFNDALESVRDATENKISTIAGGHAPSHVEAGEIIRKGYDDAVEQLFNDVDFTYNAVHEQAPGIRLTEPAASDLNSKINGIEKFAKGRVERGITDTDIGQGKQLLRAIKQVKNGNGSLKQLSEAMKDIGKYAFKKGGNSLADVPVDQQKFQDLYFAMRDSFINSTAEQLGPEVANKLIESNQLITDFNKNKDVISGILGNSKLAPEKVFSSLVLNGDTQKIKALKQVLSLEAFNKLKGAFLESQIVRDANGTFSFKTLHNNLRGKKNILGEILNPDEISSLGDIIRLGDRFGAPVLSSSGTGASNVFIDIGKGIRSGVENDTVINLLKDSARSKAAKLKGEAKWIADGTEKVLAHDSTIPKEILNNPKSKQLLARAADLTAGSKAMANLVKELKSKAGK